MTAIDLYCGAGGMSQGLTDAGLDVRLGVDSWPDALKIYGRNVRRPVRLADLCRVPEDLPHADVIVGCPPCQDYSVAGKRAEGARARLTVTFAETVMGYAPPMFAFENVPPARKCNNYHVAKRILGEHYGLTEYVLDASRYGVPQLRRRLILVGQRGGRHGQLRSLLRSGRSERPLSVREHCGERLRGEFFYRHARNAGKRAVWSVHGPAMTVTCQGWAMPAKYNPHPKDATQDLRRVRGLTVGEASMVQTFPLDWDWGGVRLVDAWTMIGNAVPVRLAEHLGRVLMWL